MVITNLTSKLTSITGIISHMIIPPCARLSYHVWKCKWNAPSYHQWVLYRHMADCLLLIIINFYGAYILRNLSSEAQQNRISKHNREQGRAKVSIRTRDNRTFMVEMQFGMSFFRKIAIVSDVFKVIGSSFQTLGAATEKARLPKLSFGDLLLSDLTMKATTYSTRTSPQKELNQNIALSYGAYA